MPIFTNSVAQKNWNSLFGKLVCSIFLLFFIQTGSIAQSSSVMDKKKAQLEMQVEQLKKDIALMERAIQATSSKKKLTEKEVANLKAQIASKSKQISKFKGEIASFSKVIKSTEVEIDSKSSQVEVLKERYSNVLREIYANIVAEKNAPFILFPDNKRFIKKNYLKTISEYRIAQANDLRKKILALEGKKEKLEVSKNALEQKMKNEDSEKLLLDKEREKKDQEISKLSDKEKKIKKQIEAKNRAAQKLNDNIQKIIEEQIRLAKLKAQQNKPKTETPTKANEKAEVYLTPKELELSRDFASNQGRLPWPVAKGNVYATFGRHEHPTLKGVFIENNGIDFKTTDGATARAVFDGSVISVFYLPTTQYCVIVKHGEYFTVYSNITTPTVKVGDTLNTKESIGTIYTDPEDKSAKVHLEIWKGKEKINPSSWLANAH